MVRKFQNRELRKLYDHLLAKDKVEKIGPIGHSFHAGLAGIKGVNQGVPGSMMRAAWWAGRDKAKMQGGK